MLEESLETINQQDIAGIFICDNLGNVSFCNVKLQQLLKKDLKVGTSIYSFLEPEQKERLQLLISKPGIQHCANFIFSDDKAFDLHIQHIEAEKIIGLVITALSEEQILRSIGQVAGKYGHDLNNLLGSLKGISDLLSHKLTKLLGDPHGLERQLELMNTAIKRSEELTRQMRGYVRYETLETSVVYLEPLLKSLVELINASQKQAADIILHCPDNIQIAANEFQLTQAFQAIISNSLDALPKKSDKCLAIIVSEIQQSVADGELQKYAEVVLIDHGKGISKDLLAKALRALYTDKAGKIGSGLGLGLPMAKHIIEDHGGNLALRSKEGVGTTVIVELPLITS